LLTLAAPAAWAQVTVTTTSTQAFAHIVLPEGVGTYVADVTITFDTPANLSPAELNVTASVVNPADPGLLTQLAACTPACAVDAAFPVQVTVEPFNVPWLFHSGLESDEGSSGNLAFLDTYDFELHTANLDCTGTVGSTCLTTPYRLFKAPVGGAFKDITDDVLKGSVRARGRGGSFSQFLIVADTRTSALVEQAKAGDQQARIQSAAIPSMLQTSLLGQLASVQSAVVQSDYNTAIGDLDQLIALIEAHAGVDIANVWVSDQSRVNDAGELLSLAATLRFTLLRLQNGN
jgi:hypothetical protein